MHARGERETHVHIEIDADAASAPAATAHRQPWLPPDVTADALLSLSLLAQVGMLARLGITHGTSDAFNDSSALFPALPSNIIGCFVMGALCDSRVIATLLLGAGLPTGDSKPLDAVGSQPLPLLRGVPATWAPALLGLRTGFCGSLTSYSSWNQAMVGLLVVRRDWRACLVAVVSGLLLPLAALVLGQRAALWAYLATAPADPTTEQGGAPAGPGGAGRRDATACRSKLLRLGAAALLSGVSVALVCVVATTGEFEALRICVGTLLAPLGALLRWRLGKLLNGVCAGSRGDAGCSGGLLRDWPLGTLAANVIASALAALLFALCDAGVVGAESGAGWRGEAALRGVTLGFCGCLSTVSTFVSEVLALLSPKLHAGSRAGIGCGCTGLAYPLGTLVLCLAVGVPAYGWAVW